MFPEPHVLLKVSKDRRICIINWYFIHLCKVFHDYSVLCVLHIPDPALTKALFEGGCLTPVPAELNDHRTKVEGRQAACEKERAKRVLSGRERKGSPCAD